MEGPPATPLQGFLRPLVSPSFRGVLNGPCEEPLVRLCVHWIKGHDRCWCLRRSRYGEQHLGDGADVLEALILRGYR